MIKEKLVDLERTQSLISDAKKKEEKLTKDIWDFIMSHEYGWEFLCDTLRSALVPKSTSMPHGFYVCSRYDSDGELSLEIGIKQPSAGKFWRVRPDLYNSYVTLEDLENIDTIGKSWLKSNREVICSEIKEITVKYEDFKSYCDELASQIEKLEKIKGGL